MVIHGFALIQHWTGYLVAMPRNKPRGGKHYDVAFPIKAKTPKIIQEAIMAAYKKLTPARIETTP